MAISNRINRRRFLGVTTAAASGLLMPGINIMGAISPSTPDEFDSTKHFWYRKPPDMPYIDSQHGNKAFGFFYDTIFLSEDNSHTWKRKLHFPDAHKITFSNIFENGNILFTTETKVFLSTDNLGSYKEIILKDSDGTDYIPHTPQNPDNPGWYFNTLHGVNSWKIGDREMLIWGNYCNVLGGASPVNIYYSYDNGETVKIAYAFGQNPNARDNGSPGGGSAGTLLGNPKNPVICRHIHSVAYNPAENAYYACTGDGDRPEGFECNWIRGTYNAKKDKWKWKVIVSEHLNSRYKAGGLTFVDGKLYWISDANGPKPYDRGIFCCDPADIAKPEKHTLLYNPNYECANMVIQDGVILAGHYATASPYFTGIIYSPDMGKTWVEYDLKEFGLRSPTRFNLKNAEGWFRVDMRTGWISLADVLFIKPK